MKKLTLILSTLLLMSSTAAFAKSKTRNFNVNMNSDKSCRLAKLGLTDISRGEEDVNFNGKCVGNKLVGRLQVHYRVSSTQKFLLEYGTHTRNGLGLLSGDDAKIMTDALAMVSGNGFSITTKHYDYVRRGYIKQWIKGKISFK